jgi:hypothetical protein
MTYTINQTNTTAAPNTLGGTYISPNSNSGLVYTTGTSTSPYWNDTLTLGNVTPGALKVQGDAEFEGDLKLKGKSLDKTLTKIEERLAILHPNEKLEEKWEKLKGLRQAYMELEAEIIEKEKIWSILKR